MLNSIIHIFRESILDQTYGRMNKTIVKSKLNDAEKRLSSGWNELLQTRPLPGTCPLDELCDARFVLQIVQTIRDETAARSGIGKGVLLEEWCAKAGAKSAAERENAAAYFRFLYHTVETVLRECLGADTDALHYERFSSWLVKSIENDAGKKRSKLRDDFDTKRYIDELRWKLAQNPGDLGAVLSLSRALFALACEQDTESKMATIGSLKELYNDYPDQPDVALDYSNALVTLSFVQDVNQIEETIEELRRIADLFPRAVGVEEAYAYGLLHYAAKQNMREGSNTIRLLRQSAESNQYSEDITAAYAQALLNLSERQSPADALQTLENLRRYVEKNATGEEILLTYARGLSALHARMGDGSAVLDKLRRFAEKYHQSDTIALCYIRSAAMAKDRRKLRETVEVAKEYCRRYPDNIQLIKAYMEALASYGTLQSLEEAEKTVSVLENAAMLNPFSADLQICFAKGLCRLAARQEPSDMELTVQQLRDLYEKNPGVVPLLQYYATGLKELCACGDPEIAGSALKRLKQLQKRYGSQDGIRQNYAVGLSHVIHCRHAERTAGALADLMDLVSRYPEDETLRTLYITTVRGLTVVDGQLDYRFLFTCLQGIAKESAKNDGVRLEQAKLLVLVCANNLPAAADEALAILREMMEANPNNLQIAAEYTKGWMNRIQKGNENDKDNLFSWVIKQRHNVRIACLYAEFISEQHEETYKPKTYKQMRKLYRNHPDSTELALCLARYICTHSGRSIGSMTSAVRSLRLLWNDFPENDTLRLLYAESVYRLFRELLRSHKDSEARGALDAVRKLAYAAPGDDKTQIFYANMLMDMIRLMPLSQATQAVTELKNLSEQFEDVTEVTACFAQGLFNLSFLQNPEEALGTLQLVRMISRQYAEYESFATLMKTCERKIAELKQEKNVESESA